MPQQYGGSFALPLSDELLDKYRELAETAESSVREAMQVCLVCCEHWWELPESIGNDKHAHVSGVGVICPLDEHIKQALDEHIPWEDELKIIAARFDTIDNETNKELRDAAHHLLWHVVELHLDREPLTCDKL